jgi:hypothetical protein
MHNKHNIRRRTCLAHGWQHRIGENWHNRATTSGGEYSITTEDGHVRTKHALIEFKKWMCYIDGQNNKYSVLNECNRMLKYNILSKYLFLENSYDYVFMKTLQFLIWCYVCPAEGKIRLVRYVTSPYMGDPMQFTISHSARHAFQSSVGCGV